MILVVPYYYLFKVSLEDVVKLMLMRGFHLSHQTVHNWHVDSTYLWIEERWCYLYRAIDKEGNLVDVYLSGVRDQAAAEQFFLQAENTTGMTPDQITTDKEPALAAAHEEVFGNGAKHRDCKYKNNRIESDHPIRTPQVDALKFLMGAHHLSPSDLPDVASQGVLSEILHKKRSLNVRQIKRLALRFGVDPSTFIDN